MAAAAESPTSWGAAARVDTPILRVPMMATPPTIDGVKSAGEWDDASALSGFWYDFASAKFLFMAPPETQLQVYAAFDKEHLYIAYDSPVYPENAWLKARGRFPDVTHHPLYGIIWDDHIEFELRPHDNLAKGFQLGLYKWFINPIGSTADQYWSLNHGEGKSWTGKAIIRSGIAENRWFLEMKIPLSRLVQKNYAATDDDGRLLVNLPPADGTAYRAWFTRGIGGNSTFFNAFDAHVWNTTKTKLILDSKAVGFQINELDHDKRSQSVRIGFFVESDEGPIYSSYDASELNDGLLELRPGEQKKLRLRKPFPGISSDGNVLWFDVRSGGRPSKVLFRTRLIRFHSMDGGEVPRGEGTWAFRDRRVNVIATMRPPRRDFDFHYSVSSYQQRVSGVVDIGIYGGSDEAKAATEASITIRTNDDEERVVVQERATFAGNFATFLFDAPGLTNGESYQLSLLLFDANKRIVGERNPEPFTYTQYEWQNNKIGLDDVVWEPFVAIKKRANGFETLNHVFEIAATGLPAQISIKANRRELPLEKRDGGTMSPADLLAIGRGPQLRAPLRWEAIVDGTRLPATVVKPAALVRQWRSEFEYQAVLKAGPVAIRTTIQYDCDGAMLCKAVYGGPEGTTIDGLELVMDVAGMVDLKLSAAHGGGMAGSDVWELTLPDGEGVVWDSAVHVEPPDLFYSRFIPYFWFGSADRAFTFFCDSDEHWGIDRDGSTMTLERDGAGAVTWRVKVVNHTTSVAGEHPIQFTLLTHPSKPKPEAWRRKAWFWRGGVWADEYIGGDFTKSDEELQAKAQWMVRILERVKEPTAEQVATWTRGHGPYWRFYQLRAMGNAPPPRFPWEERQEKKWDELKQGYELDQAFEDKVAYYFQGHIRTGRRHGWWWDETWPTYRSTNLAEGNAYLRPAAEVGKNELPWQDQFLTHHMRNSFKRLARVFKSEGVPQRNYLWANTSATCFESFAWDTQLVEECGSGHRSYEIQNMIAYPNSLYRHMAHHFTGLITRYAPEPKLGQGDDPTLDRQVLGRALANDVGVFFDGPHGDFCNREIAIGLINILEEFGFFEDQGTEYIPYWRSEDVFSYGDAPEGVQVTAFRRPRDGGGYKALILILNEGDADVEQSLTLRAPERLLGGNASLQSADVLARDGLEPALAAWWQRVAANAAVEGPVMKDAERGDLIAGTSAIEYGPIHVRRHDYRLLYVEGGR
jgi:hypothetical protein